MKNRNGWHGQTEIATLEDEFLYYLVEQVVERMKIKEEEEDHKWLTGDKVMEFLGIKSKTTLQNLRDTGKIRFTQPQKKIILYDRDSIRVSNLYT